MPAEYVALMIWENVAGCLWYVYWHVWMTTTVPMGGIRLKLCKWGSARCRGWDLLIASDSQIQFHNKIWHQFSFFINSIPEFKTATECVLFIKICFPFADQVKHHTRPYHRNKTTNRYTTSQQRYHPYHTDESLFYFVRAKNSIRTMFITSATHSRNRPGTMPFDGFCYFVAFDNNNVLLFDRALLDGGPSGRRTRNKTESDGKVNAQASPEK